MIATLYYSRLGIVDFQTLYPSQQGHFHVTLTVFRTTYRLCLGLALIGRFLHHTKSELPPTTNLALESRKTHHAALPPLCRPRTGSASNMDVGLVRSRIVATLDADADARRRAELDLKAVRTISPLFLPTSR